ncbi:unnamed protein product [Rhizoctonia solani]|uniref:RING-type domain-containing protein n=1 Tax=Rhizoctonia solani TaxID=456999 RepID=A0A8H3H2Y2_9AGAM|nr:unnamed protein product [Rhizoctonia solani]
MEGKVGEESQISTFSIDDEISCGICLGVLESPYTVIPCLHTFDRDCLLGWWQRNDTWHPSGYTCPIPIPEPTEAVKDSEAQDYLNGRRAIIEPGRGNRRIPFAEGLHNAPGAEHLFTAELKAEINRACEEHVACLRCASYLPRNWPGRAQSICKGCGDATCEAFDQIGCPQVMWNSFLTPFNEVGNTLDPGILWERVSGMYPHFFRNLTERQRFLDRLAANNITPSSVTQELLREAGHGDADYFCSVCIGSTVQNGFAESWRRKIENGEVPLPGTHSLFLPLATSAHLAQVPNLSNCWYGRDCRTQSHNVAHATRLNHDCDPRPPAAQQVVPALDPAPAPAPALGPDDPQD